MDKVQCHISKIEVPQTEAKKGEELPHSLFDLIQKEHPDFSKGSFISTDTLNLFRKNYIEKIIRQEKTELNKLEHEVIDAISGNKILSENIEDDFNEDLTIGQKAADKIAAFGGSWTFIIFFFSFILVWIGVNIWFLAGNPFDKYPFILLNLLLSCLAAIQAPIIMMSQNRKEQKDRQRSEHDYQINLKAELEIKLLHEKLDHLMIHQNKRLLEIQEVQVDYLEDILKELKGKTAEKNNSAAL